MKTKAIHYSGEVIHAMGLVLPGWAACCSGKRAEDIREQGQNTEIREHVTCKACLKMIAKGDDWEKKERERMKAQLPASLQ